MDVLLVVDMQEGLLRGAPKHDLLAVVERINRLAVRVRRSGGSVVFVQHAGPVGDDFEPLTPGWHLLATIKTEPGDRNGGRTFSPHTPLLATGEQPGARPPQHTAAAARVVAPVNDTSQVAPSSVVIASLPGASVLGPNAAPATAKLAPTHAPSNS